MLFTQTHNTMVQAMDILKKLLEENEIDHEEELTFESTEISFNRLLDSKPFNVREFNPACTCMMAISMHAHSYL